MNDKPSAAFSDLWTVLPFSVPPYPSPMPLQTFRHYTICQDHQGATVEVWRGSDEVACPRLRQQPAAVRGTPRGHWPRRTLARCRQFSKPRPTRRSPPPPPPPRRHRRRRRRRRQLSRLRYLDGERLDSWLARCHPLPPWLALSSSASSSRVSPPLPATPVCSPGSKSSMPASPSPARIPMTSPSSSATSVSPAPCPPAPNPDSSKPAPSTKPAACSSTCSPAP